MPLVPYNSVGGFSTGLTMTGVIDSFGNITGLTGTFTNVLTGSTAIFLGLVSSTVGFSGPGTNITGVVTSFNNQTGAVTGVTVGGTNVFTSLNTFNAGISASGGVTLAGTLQGTTAAFTGLVSSTVGFSGSGTNLKNIVTTFNGLSGAVEGVSSVNGQTGAVTIASATNVVTSFNGLTGAVQGVSAAVAGTGISVSGATGAVTITNTGVQSFNGSTGAVTGVSRVNGLSGGITFAAGTGITFTTSGNTITVASAPKSTTQTLDFSENINGIEYVIYDTGGDLGTSLQNIETYNTIIPAIVTYTLSFSCIVDSIKSFYDPINGWSARVILKAPFTDTISLTNYTAESVLALGFSSLNFDLTSASGLIVSDYWTSLDSSNVYHQEETYAVKTVTGQTWVTADSYITCKVLGITTADHTPEDAILEGVQFEINNIVAGTGFDIIGHAPEGTYGKYTVKCIEQ
jgi:hypothetical protein